MDKILIHNTLSGKKEEFLPIESGKVKMYVCGITPYDECHLGHARCYVFFDVVRRFLTTAGFQVTYIQNFTDIDDKIVARAKTLNQPWRVLANHYIEDYFQKMDSLNVQKADAYPRVTELIPEIIAYVKKLIEKDAAYVVDGDVYFSVRKFSGYGKLSKRNLHELEAGARVEVDERKQNPLDFALWKKAKPEEPAWDSPWGPGRPGWHIECSVMSTKHLGETFDIHGGGQDLIFPHHENEIAQSESASGKTFARTWIHNGFVTLNKEKMSKSLGNFFSLREIFENFSPEVVRFFLLSRHYRSPLDFSDDLLHQAQKAWDSLEDIYDMAHFIFWREKNDIPQPTQRLTDFETEFMNALADDLNTEKAISILFNLRSALIEKINRRDILWIESAVFTIKYLCEDILGCKFLPPPYGHELQNLYKTFVDARETARREKKWAEADNIRNHLLKMGYRIEDTPWGARLKKSKQKMQGNVRFCM